MEFLPLTWHLHMGQSLYRYLRKVQCYRKRKYIAIYTSMTAVLTDCCNPELPIGKHNQDFDNLVEHECLSKGGYIEWPWFVTQEPFLGSTKLHLSTISLEVTSRIIWSNRSWQKHGLDKMGRHDVLKSVQRCGILQYAGEIIPLTDCSHCKTFSSCVPTGVSPGFTCTLYTLCFPGDSVWKRTQL